MRWARIWPLATSAEQLFERGTAAKFRQVAKPNDAILGKASDESRDVPRHKQRLDMGDKDLRLFDGTRIAGR
jgi:hypothetical protein